MKVSMILKLVAMSSAAVGTQAAFTCTTDAFCATADSSKPHCIYTSAAASECKAALLATTTACFVKSTKDLKQCAATDYCNFGDATAANQKCTPKIAAGTAAVGATAAEKAHSCKSGEAGATNCETVSDAGCTAEAGSAQYLVKPSALGAAACTATLIATNTACFKISTKATIQCATTDYCNFGDATAANQKCTPKIAAGTAPVGGTDDEKKHSCLSGEVAAGVCATVSDAGCAATSSGTPYYVKPSAAGAAACAAGIAANANCFQISTDALNQCVSPNTCFAADGACKNPTNDADCKAAIASKPFYVKATATGASACGVGLAKDAQCFIKTTATANQCADGHYCPATSDAATNKCAALVATGGDCTAGGAIACQSGICTSNKCAAIADAAACAKVTTATFNQCGAASYCPATSSVATNTCKAKLAKDGDCTTIGGIACKSNTCTSNKCVDSSAPTTSPTKATKAPSKAPTKADHSDASAITASSFVVAATVFASSMFA